MRVLPITFLLLTVSWSCRADEGLGIEAQSLPSDSADEGTSKVSEEKVDLSVPVSGAKAGAKAGSKSKSNSNSKRLGTVTLRQFPSKVRVEFEGTALRKGHYALFSVDSCSGLRAGKVTSAAFLRKRGRELHSFSTETGEIYTEKSLPETSLQPDAENSLHHQSIVLAQKTKSSLEVIACGQLQ